jgi:hypothetical protein
MALSGKVATPLVSVTPEGGVTTLPLLSIGLTFEVVNLCALNCNLMW